MLLFPPLLATAPCPAAEYAAAWEAVAKDIIYVPAQERYTRAASATAQDRVASLQVRCLEECLSWPRSAGSATSSAAAAAGAWGPRPRWPPPALGALAPLPTVPSCLPPALLTFSPPLFFPTLTRSSFPICVPQAQFEGVRKEMEKEAKRAAKLEQKVRRAAAHCSFS